MMWLRGLLFSALLTGCSQLTTEADFDSLADFSHYQTWRWYQPDGKTPAYQPDGLTRQRIRSAISRSMPSIGLAQSSLEQADLLVHFYTKTEQRLRASTRYNDRSERFQHGYWPTRYGYDGSRYGFAPHHVITDYSSYQLDTLYIDFIDGRTGQLVWQGSGTKPSTRANTPAKRSAQTQQLVQEILQQYPAR